MTERLGVRGPQVSAVLVEEPLKTLTTWLAARALQRFGRAPLDWAAALRRLAARHMPERTP